MLLTLETRNPATGYWHEPAETPVRLGERARLRVTITGAAPLTACRLYTGDVLMASSLWEDRAEYHLRPQAFPAGSWVAVGKMLRDWVGETDLRAEVLDGGKWATAATLGPVYVEPERLNPEE